MTPTSNSSKVAWEENKLSKISEIVMGQSPKGESCNQLGLGMPLLNGPTEFGIRYPVPVQYTKEPTKLSKRGDILFCVRGSTTGRMNWSDKEYAIGRGLAAIRHIHGSEYQYFVKGIIDHHLQHLLASATGSTFPNVSRDLLAGLDISLPPLPEQKAIAMVLSSLDDKIDLLHRQNKTLESMAETLFRQWFVEGADEDWQEFKLEDLLTVTSSKRIFYSEYVESGIPFYRSKEIIELHNKGNTECDLFISEKRFNEINEKYGSPSTGDILLTSVGTLGIPYKVKKGSKFYFKDGNLTWFKDFKNISSDIIYCWLNSRIGREALDAITIGSTQPALTIRGLKELKLLLPPKNLLTELEMQLKFIYQKLEINNSQSNHLEKLRDSLLPKLMSGEVRVAYGK